MLKLGEKIISDIYLGDKKIAKAFLGDKLVYQAGEPIFLDYIEFDGKSWIDTGITELGGTWSVTASADNSTQLRFLIGNGGQAGQYYGALSNGKWGLGTASEEYYFENARTSKMTAEVIFEESQATATVDGVTIVRPGTRTSDNFLLCGYQSSASMYLFKGDVYHCSYISVNKELIQDLRPCIDPKGTVCMYDMVTKKYFYNQGTGTLTAGNIIKFVDYIESDGNSYINTGIIPTTNTGAYINYESLKSHEDCVILGSRKNSGDTRVYPFALASANAVACGRGLYLYLHKDSVLTYPPKNNHIGAPLNTPIESWYNYKNSGVFRYKTESIDITSGQLNTLDFTCTYSMYLFAGNIYGNFLYPATIRVKNVVITEGEAVIQDLRPCIVASQACFYDMVTGKIFTNAGTGTLKAGGEINLANFTILGTTTIDNGIVSNLSETSYITTKTNYGLHTASCWSIIFPTIKVNEFSKYFWGANAQYSGIVLAVNSSGKIVVYISSNGTQWDIASGINNLYSNLQFSKGEEVNIRLDFTGSKYVLYILKDNAWQEQTSVTSSLKVGYFEHFRIGQWTNYYRFDSTMDLKTFIVVADGKVTSALK